MFNQIVVGVDEDQGGRDAIKLARSSSPRGCVRATENSRWRTFPPRI